MEVTEKSPRGGVGGLPASAPWVRNILVAVTLGLILLLALGLRFYGLDWDRGFPYTPHPDERAILAKIGELSFPSLDNLGELLDADVSGWNPRWFPYGSFPLYLLKGVQGLSSVWPWGELHDLRIAGRTISALADVGAVALLYFLGARLYGRREALLASALMALAVLHIQLSHFYAVDTILALCTVAALYFLYGVARAGRLRDSLLAGAFIGLGLATKASQAPIYIAFVMAHLLYLFNVLGGDGGPGLGAGDRWRRALGGLVAGAAASLLVVFVAQPYTFLDWDRFRDQVGEQSEMVRRIRDYPYTRQYVDTTPYLYQIRQLATWGLWWPLGIVAWAGLLYASLRGMRPRRGLVYLAVGWGLPMALLLSSSSLVVTLVASGIAFVALVATLPFRSADSRGAVLLLSWVTPYFLITGAFEVKFIRYLIPITPLLLLMGSRMVVALWDRVESRWRRLRPLVAAGILLLVGGAGFYAFSYMAVYGDEHTALRTSQWINENVPRGSVILREHWEEGIPGLGDYKIRVLPLYEDDTTEKLEQLSEDLSAGDYVVFFSNRLYGTIPRLPERYPFTSAYYRLLFSGGLGYELVSDAVETAYPRLAGVSFVHDTLGRPDLRGPEVASATTPSGLALNLGFADESYSVYDHPVGLVFRNVARRDTDAMKRTLEEAVPGGFDSRVTPVARTVGLLLSPEDAEAQRQGGTWTEIIRPGSWANRYPVLAWLILVEAMALLALPLTFVLFRPLADRGYLFSKALGLLSVGLLVWLLASLRWVPFTRGSIGLAMLLFSAASTVVLFRQRRQIVDFARERWRVILVAEALFVLAFLAFVLVRMANPDLWHPFRGGEKPMELAYLNAVLRSSYMPPYDPWFSGGYLNYYYWGQFLVATLIKATGIDPRVAFNLAVPTFFAMAVGGAYTVVYNLAAGTRRSLSLDSAQEEGTKGDKMSDGRGAPWSPVLAGIGGALSVTVVGNLDGAIQVGHGLWRVLVRSGPFGEFDFWRSSRMMPPDPPGHEITEFPFFTFLFADLHPNLMGIPFALLALGLALAVVLGAARVRRGKLDSPGRHVWGLDELGRLATLGVVVGAIRLINTWDYPTYLIVAASAITLAEYFRRGGLGLAVLVESGAKSALVVLVGYLAFLPFHLSYETFFTSLDRTTNQTVLWQFLAISGLFIFIIGSFYASESKHRLLRWWHVLRRIAGLRIVALALVALLSALVVVTAVSGLPGSTIPFLLALEALVLIATVRFMRSARADAPYLAFVAVIVSVSLALAIGLDIFRVEGDVDRMNSVFKFYLQIWVMLALASAYILWRLAHGRRTPLMRLAGGKKVWLGALAVLIVSASVYSALGTQDRLRDRFNDRVLPMTLDGMAYMRDAVYGDVNGDIELYADYEGIKWLQDNVRGSPVVLEGGTPIYRWGGRISVYTGLPVVLGWQWHQEQQRWGYRWAIGQRADDVRTIYTTDDASEALALLRRYGVEYVYVGQLESLYYPRAGLEKFDNELKDQMDVVYENDHVKVYRVRQG